MAWQVTVVALLDEPLQIRIHRRARRHVVQKMAETQDVLGWIDD
jgi:hypothetical protein